jgi:hypothetical protein
VRLKNTGGIVKILPVRPNPDLSGEGGSDFLGYASQPEADEPLAQYKVFER